MGKDVSHKKKVFKFLKSLGLYILIGGISGFFAGYFFTNYELSIPAEYTALPFYIEIMIFIFTYIIAVLAHELGHFFVFIRNGIKMRALFVTLFIFKKEDEKWKFRINPNSITASGGIAIPDLEVVEDSDEFKRLQKAYAKVMLAGPLTSIFFCIVVLLITVPIFLTISSVIIKSVLFMFSASIVVITLFIIISSLLKTEMVVGDFPAYKIAKNDNFLVAMQLYQYAMFSTDYEDVRRNNDYLRSLIVEGLYEKLEKEDIHVYTMNIIDTLIVEYLSGVIDSLPEAVDEYVDFLIDNNEAFEVVKTSEYARILWFHIIRLLYEKRDQKEKAVELFYRIKGMIDEKSSINKYLTKQAEHLLGIDDNSDFLKDKKNINLSSADSLYKNFEGYYSDEIKLNKAIL
ncbi:MAG: M50 family metallopeptidase [Halanaerobiales bacterium]